MESLSTLIIFLDQVIAEEAQKPLDMLGGYIVGELIGDYENKYEILQQRNAKVQQISDLASDLEISNGSPDQLKEMWADIKRLSEELKRELSDTK